MTTIPKIPFTMDAWGGFGQMTGLARLDERGIVFEYQTKDNLVEVIKTDLKESAIAFADIENVIFNKGWFGFFASFTVVAHSLAAVQNIPGSDGHHITISIARKDREKTKQFVSHISTVLTERMLAKEQAVMGELGDAGELKDRSVAPPIKNAVR
jgi:hypothetical protein